ncbi:MAG: DNA-processing protein DprA, partial [Clostridia bacterium]|nr:DNA-processing protein DprA [Clostridia bacterium]
MKDSLYAVWLAENCGYCSVLGKALIGEFGSCESVYNAERLPKELEGKRLPRDFGRRCDLEKAQKILRECEQKSITVIGLDDDRYPERLSSIADAPVALYDKGDLGLLWELDETPALSMVGPRDMTVHGQKAA